MNETLTTSIRERIARDGTRPRTADLYSTEGARFYEDMVGADRSEIREFLALARSVRGRILDIAAGSGRITIPLLSIGKSVTALDLADDMLDILRAAAPPHSDLDILRADMRDFVTDHRFDLVVIAATSIILLDADGRRRLFDTVRRHLVPGGRFAFSVAGAGATAELRRTVDREVTVTRNGRSIGYVSSQELISEGTERLVNFAPIAAGPSDPIFTTRLHIVDEAMASAEIVAAGFRVPTVHLVRTAAADPGEAIVILETSWPN